MLGIFGIFFFFRRLILKFDNENVDLVFKNVFKEVNKESSNIDESYRISSLRCLSDLLQFSSSNFRDSDFELYWTSVIERFFQKNFEILAEIEKAVEERRKQDNEEDENNSKQAALEQIKKIKLSDESQSGDNGDEAEDKFDSPVKITCLETFGKCWPYSDDIQGKFFLKQNKKNFILNKVFF